MARQKGIVVIKGTLNGMNFYVRNGEPLVRRAGGGFNGKAIKSKPSMIRVRENGSEFAGCMRAVKHFKIALYPLFPLYKDGKTHQRLVQLFTQIKVCDTVSERGKRCVGLGMQTAAGKTLLNGYVISSESSLATILGKSYRFEWATDGFTIDSLSISKIRFPKGGTHLELIVGWLAFDFVTYDYSFIKSEPVLLGKDSTQASLQIAPTVLPEEGGTHIGVVFLRFKQEINGIHYPMKQAEHVAMEIVYCA